MKTVDGVARIRTDASLPRPVERVRHLWVTTRDSTRLSARMWLPRDADGDPVPAVLEVIPYRKTDAYAPIDEQQHRYIAGHGYAVLRVDLRGTGDSEGILHDEYLSQELDDIEDVIAWAAAEPWCTGSVGMMGISWGGFNSLQVAARRPEALKAIITIASSDDRYADDVHYMGGCLLASEMLPWASNMFAFNARPPDPTVVGDRWRQMWFDRMAETPPYIEAWLAHQRRDGFWRHGSVCESYGDITCAVYAVGGWADPYRNTVLRLLEHLDAPVKGLIGPWGHAYPQIGAPGPAIGFLQESLRWWDHWLKGVDRGVLDEPKLIAWMPEWFPPAAQYSESPGRWIAEPVWPPRDGFTERRLHVSASGELDEQPSGHGTACTLTSQQITGMDAGTWCPDGSGTGWAPPDQRSEDGRSLCFDTPPLTERLEILGRPSVDLEIAVDQPKAILAVRLCDVAPDGSSKLVTRGLLNLTHRNGDDEPEQLEPGATHRVRVELTAIAHAFESGHRMRLALSTSYWPWAWPSPAPVSLTVHHGAASMLSLPVRAPRPEDAELREFDPPEVAVPLERVVARATGWRRRSVIDHGRHLLETTFGNAPDGDEYRLVEEALTYGEIHEDIFRVVEQDPLSAHIECRWTIRLARDDWDVRIVTRSTMSADNDRFHVTNVLEGYEAESRVFAKTWDFATARDGV